VPSLAARDVPCRGWSEGFDFRQRAETERISRTSLLVDGTSVVTRKAHGGTSVGITFVMATVIAATAASACSWAHPGANPYRGDPLSALSDFTMTDETRRQLRVLMAAHRYTDVATITRDAIVGQQRYEGLREMHSGRGQTCHGAVDRSAWSDQLQERGLVYCAGDTCVIVPTICNNVSLVTRKPDELAQAAEEEPIDISPAAGPPSPVAASPLSQDNDLPTPDFFPVPVSEGGGSVAGITSGGGGASAGGDTGCAAGCFIGGGGGNSGSDVGGGPISSGPSGGPGSPTGPANVPPPGSLPPVSAVPEAPTSMLMFIGLISLMTYRRIRKNGREREAADCLRHG
jgi:hypothetical protein